MVRKLPNLLASVVKRDLPVPEPFSLRDTCLVCEANLSESELYIEYRVCSVCRFHYSLGARERIQSLADSGTFREINRSVVSLDPLSFSTRVSYKMRLFQDQRRTGLTEAVVTGTCAIGGSPAVMIVLDFGFMGGSMGCVVGEKVALAMEHAVKRKLPVVAVVTSGGARIQEGVLSLMQMAKTSIAAGRLNEKGLPFISVLANPTTGQTYASFANLADMILAEPGAIVGFAPMREVKKSSGQPLPHGSHTAEAHLQFGMLDQVVERTELRDLIATLLDLLGPQFQLTLREKSAEKSSETGRRDAWESVRLARHKERPTALDYVNRICSHFVELHGDRIFGDDEAVVMGLAYLGSQTVVIVGQERRRNAGENTESMLPEGFRKAQRAMRLASKFGLPLITFVDTPGPQASLDAEQRGIGNAIATTMSCMEATKVPSIAVIIGEGGGEAALAFAVADRVVMLDHAIYSIVSPEEAAGLIFQDETRAEEVVEALRLTSDDCKEMGIVDEVIAEPPGGAHRNPDEAARHLRRVLLRHLAELQGTSERKRLSTRYKKFRKMGEYNSRARAAISREVNALQGLVATGVKKIARSRKKAIADDGGT